MLDTTILVTYQFTFSGALTRAKRARCKAPKTSKFRYQSGPEPDLDIWWRHPHLQNGAHAEKHEGRSVPGSLLCLEVSFPHTTLRAVTLDNEKSGVWRKNAVRWTFVRSWESFPAQRNVRQGAKHRKKEGECHFLDCWKKFFWNLHKTCLLIVVCLV